MRERERERKNERKKERKRENIGGITLQGLRKLRTIKHVLIFCKKKKKKAQYFNIWTR